MVDNLFKGMPKTVEMLMNRNPMKRIGSPHEMGGAVVWLASDASSFVTGTKYVVAVSSRLHVVDRTTVA